MILAADRSIIVWQGETESNQESLRSDQLLFIERIELTWRLKAPASVSS